MLPIERATAVAEFLSQRPIARAPVGSTPHEIVHRQHETALRYFAPRGEQKARPLFISVPLINTWTVFDLLPGRSVVEALITGGVPVYLLDWGRPGIETLDRRLSAVIDDILPRAIRRATRDARARGLLAADALPDALGYCVGGSFLAVTLARHPGLARRMALLAAPIDFHASGRLATWANPETFPLDDLVDGLGNFPPELMQTSFAWLRPTGQVDKWKSLWDRIDAPGFKELWAALERWNGDNIPFAGECYREYVRECYFNNALVAGGWTLSGRPVDLKQGTIPALAIAATRDHICPPAAAFGLEQAWGGPVATASVDAGHVGVCVGSRLPRVLLEWAQP